jgi:hypothetical protein
MSLTAFAAKRLRSASSMPSPISVAVSLLYRKYGNTMYL